VFCLAYSPPEALAKASRRSSSFLAAEAIENYIAAESWQLAEIEAGVKDFEASRTADRAAVQSWLKSWGRSGSARLPDEDYLVAAGSVT